MTERRTVRVSPAAFDQLDDKLRQERGPIGQPSVGDFIVLELPAVVERFATGFDELPEIIEGTPSGRMLIAPGLLVRAYVAYGVLLDDDTIEILGISIDPCALGFGPVTNPFLSRTGSAWPR